MGKSIVNTKKAPSALGPYSQAVKTGNFVFTSGQLSINLENNELEKDDIKKATALAIENLAAILEEAGTTLDKVVKTTVFLKDLNDFKDVNEVYATYFKENCPARSCVQVAKLPLDALIEIEAIAEIERL